MHNDSSGGTIWRRTNPVISSGVYNSTGDLSVECDIDGSADLKFFVDVSDISGHDTAKEQYLTNSSGVTKWTTVASATGADEKLAATAENTGVYWDGLHNEFSTVSALTTGQDLLVESQLAGSTPDQNIRLFVDCSDISGFSAGAFQYLTKDSSDIIKWTTFPATTDKLVAVQEGNTPGYLGDQFTNYSTAAAFELGNDLFVQTEYNAGEIIPFVDASTIPNYNSTELQFLAHGSDATIQWSSGTGSGGIDEKLAATSENSGVYWSGLHADYNASTVFNSTQDFKVESEVTGTTPNQDIRLYIDNSDLAGYDASYHQFLLHNDSSGGLVWRRSAPVISSGVYNSTQDMKVEIDIDASGDLQWFVDASDISGFSTAKDQFLNNNLGALKWTTISAGGASTVVDTDERLAATSDNSGRYWGGLHNEFTTGTVLTTGQDLLVESQTAGTTPNQVIRLFVDVSDISGWVSTNRQFLYHDTSGNTKWVDATTCT
jgi:hypothetical protein